MKNKNEILELFSELYGCDLNDISITWYTIKEDEPKKPSNKGRKPKPHQVTDCFVEVGGAGTC
jgi:hypothetical protein